MPATPVIYGHIHLMRERVGKQHINMITTERSGILHEIASKFNPSRGVLNTDYTVVYSISESSTTKISIIDTSASVTAIHLGQRLFVWTIEFV